MKKSFLLLISLICAIMITTTGFAATPSNAYSTYKKAAKNLDAATSIEMSGTGKTTTEMGGTEISASTQKITMKILQPSGGKMQMEMHSKDSETNSSIDIYYKDGYMYQNADGVKTKSKLDVKNVLSSADALDTSMGEVFFKDATVEQTADGTLIKFKMKLSDLKNIDGTPILDEISKSASDAKIKTSNISYSMLIGPDNKLKSYTTTFNLTMDYLGASIKTKSTTSYKIVSIDKVSKINFPADLGSYK